MSLEINSAQIHGYERMRYMQSLGALGVQGEATARGVDAYRAEIMPGQIQQNRDQVALQTAGDWFSGIRDWASDAYNSFFGGSEPVDAGQQPPADGAPAAAGTAIAEPAASSSSFQDAAVESLRATGDGLLSVGSSGPEVEALQEMLKAEGYDLGDAGVDGQFGPATRAAVEAFQRDQAEKAENPEHVSAVDGIVGAQTRASLGNAALARADKMDSTVDKLNAGGERGGPDALRAEEAASSRDEAAKKAADSAVDSHVERNSVSGPSAADRARETDKAAGGEAARGGEARA